MKTKDWDIKYARREPTKDYLIIFGIKKYDVVIYDDKKCTKQYCRFPWFSKSKPRRGTRNCIMNCFRWKLEWVDNCKNQLKRLA